MTKRRRPRTLNALRVGLSNLNTEGTHARNREGRPDFEASLYDWTKDAREQLMWARALLESVAPDRAARINWNLRGPAAGSDLIGIFTYYKTQVESLVSMVSVWDDERKLLQLPPREFVLIDADKPYSAWLRLAQLLKTAHSEVWAADPYVTEDSLALFLPLPDTVSVKLLGLRSTPTPVRWKGFVTERGGQNEFRLAPAQKAFHDRFLGIDGRVFLSGASLKQVGERFSALVELVDAQNRQHIASAFAALWNSSAPLD